MIAPAAGTYTDPLTVVLNTGYYGASIRYTTNGSTPTSASTLYAGPFTLTSSATVNAVEFVPGYAMSAVASAAYTIIPKGQLHGSQVTAAPSYDLTALGTVDWVHWGRNHLYGHFDHKAGGTEISNVTPIQFTEKGYNPASFYGGANSSRSVNWTDGAPTKTDRGDDGFISAQGLGAGFRFVVPALTTPQTLYIYAGGIGSALTLQARLSDGSAPDYTVFAKSSAKPLFTDIIEITFKAGTEDPLTTLTITLINYYSTSSRVDLIAAALA